MSKADHSSDILAPNPVLGVTLPDTLFDRLYPPLPVTLY